MSGLTARPRESESARPVGVVRPRHERASRAFKALDEKRLKDARANTEAMPEAPILEYAWKLVLRGLICLEQPDFAQAEPALREGASAALVAGLGGGPENDPDALSFEKVGGLYRRRDRPEAAYRAHLAAYRLRREYGSFEEMWATAVSLGIDADLARWYTHAEKWHRIAIDVGASAPDGPERGQAIAWANLASSFTNRGRYREAVDAAGNAREHWRAHDIGSLEAARADMYLGHALLKLGEALHTEDQEQAKRTLEEAIDRLDSARESLLPFGRTAAADARWCLDQTDFARRFRASLGG